VTTASVSIDGDVCSIAGVIDFASAPSLLEKVSAEIQSGRDLTVDLAEVTDANSAALALLLQWKEQAAECGGQVIHQNLPDSMRQLSEICQVSTFI